MPPQCRVGDKSLAAVDGHGCPACPHPAVQGPAISGEVTVLVNNKPAVRMGDQGIHTACCGPNMWVAQMASATVTMGFQFAHRMGDMDIHCGGVGAMIEGSFNVITGG